MSDMATPNPIGTGNVTVISEPPETSEARAAIQHDEHVACLTQEVEDLRGELNQVKDLTNLSIILQSPPSEPRNTAPNPSRFPSLDSLIPKHFPPQYPPSINNNSLPATSENPPNQPPTYTPLQSHPPTYTTHVAPPNPPLVNPPSQLLVHIPYVSPPAYTYPPPTTTLSTQPSQPLTNTPYNPVPPPIQNTPNTQNYPA
ncbi:extensin-like [Capsicum galapagoense]